MADLNNIPLMIEVVDSGSFSAAARALGVPPSLVSRKIARLETEVGARLFQRTTRSLILTEAGEIFLAHARTAMQAMVAAGQALSESVGTLAGKIRISAPLGIAEAMWEVVARFMVEHAAVRIEIELGDHYVDLIEERFDLAVRSSPEQRSEKLVGRRLGDAQRCLFASPAYIATRGEPKTVAELKHHDCVILGARADRVTWTLHSAARSDNVVVQGRVSVNEAKLAAQCAVDGFGIAFLPVVLCYLHVDAGRLVKVLPRFDSGDTGLWLVYPDRHLPATTRAFVDFLARELPLNFQRSGSK
jgi:DNA-binding transcriptional LysR family regulator